MKEYRDEELTIISEIPRDTDFFEKKRRGKVMRRNKFI